jgi:hypothetical protein
LRGFPLNDMFGHPRAPESRMNRAGLFALFLGIALGLAGCISAERRAADDRAQCEAQGLAPSTGAYADCIGTAAARHDDAEAKQQLRMRQVHEQEIDNFLTSTSPIP